MSSQPNISQPLISTKTAMFTKKNALILLAVVVVLSLCGGLYYWKYVRGSRKTGLHQN